MKTKDMEVGKTYVFSPVNYGQGTTVLAGSNYPFEARVLGINKFGMALEKLDLTFGEGIGFFSYTKDNLCEIDKNDVWVISEKVPEMFVAVFKDEYDEFESSEVTESIDYLRSNVDTITRDFIGFYKLVKID